MVQGFDGHHPVVPESVYLHETAVVIGRVTLGERCSLWPHVVLRGDEGFVAVGDDTNLQDGTTVHMTGGESDTVIGARVTVGHNCILHGCRIEDDCLIGMGALIMDNAVIGRGSFIGAGTLITAGKVIPPGSMVFGRPMKIVRATNERDRASIDYGWRRYVERSRMYLAQQRGG
jgi:gamma-carbonic anhydrase